MSGAASLNLCGQLKCAALVFPTKTPDLARGKQELPSQAWLQLHWCSVCSIPLWQDTSAALTTLSKPQVHWGHLYSTAEQTKLNIFHTLAELRPTDRDGNTNQSQQEPHNDNTELSSPQKLFNSSRHLKKRFFLTWAFHPPLFHSQKKKLHWKPAKILISNTPRGSEFSPWKCCSSSFSAPVLQVQGNYKTEVGTSLKLCAFAALIPSK